MTRSYLRDRQARRRQEGQQFTADMCAFCKRAKRLRIGGFCSYDCERDAAEAAEQLAAMKAKR